ncbi:MAG: hypothetical protein ACO1SV_08760 [Fimbriimonas sp.]
MDLDRCPKCGAAWQGGDACRNCRFVPIGAGLDKLPKKKKRKARRYVEPGSSQGLLLTIFVGVIAFGSYRYQPWKDDWEMMRALVGQGRRHSVVGEWEVVKTMTVKKSGDRLIGNQPIQKGTLAFSKKGTVSLTLVRGKAKSVGAGKYAVTGQLVAMNDIKVTASAAGPLPGKMNLRLAWTGPDTLVAANGSEAIYLRRLRQANPIAKLMQMGLKPGNAEAPGAMRGVIATMQKNLDQAEPGE